MRTPLKFTAIVGDEPFAEQAARINDINAMNRNRVLESLYIVILHQ